MNVLLLIKVGSSETNTLLHLQRYLEGVHTKQDVEIFNRLLLEANNQLHLIKVPSAYRVYGSYIKGLNLNILDTATKMSLDNIVEEMTKLEKVKISSSLGEDFYISGAEGLEDQEKTSIKQTLNKLLIQELDPNEDNGIEHEETKNLSDESLKEIKKQEKVYSVILGDSDTLPSELKGKDFEELEELGGELITEFDVQSFADGRLEMESLTEEKKEKLMKILETINTDTKDVDEFSDDDKESEK